jgi:hypothetical protein
MTLSQNKPLPIAKSPKSTIVPGPSVSAPTSRSFVMR